MGETRASYYGVYGIPDLYFDGILNPYSNMPPYDDELDERLAVSSPLKMTLSGSVEDAFVTYDLSIKVLESFSGTDVKVLFVLMENGVESGGEIYNGVARWAGDEQSVSVRDLDESESFSSIVDIDESWNPANLKLVAFVQDRSTKEVFQAAQLFLPELSWEETLVTAESDDDRVIYLLLENTYGIDMNYRMILDKSGLPDDWDGNFCFKQLCVTDSSVWMMEAGDTLAIKVAFLDLGSDTPEAEMNYTVAFDDYRSQLIGVNLTGRSGKVVLENGGYDVDDDQSGGSWGNSDGKIQPGEMVELATTASNPGVLTAFDVESIIECSDQYVAVVNPDEEFGDVEAGGEAEGGGAIVAFYEDIQPGYIEFVQTFTDGEGNSVVDTFFITVEAAGVGDDEGGVPVGKTGLMRNYPNPFNPVTTIPFRLKAAGEVDLCIYDLYGKLVKEFDIGLMPAGDHSVTWDGAGENGARAASGVYFYRLKTGDKTFSRKMVMIK